MQKPHIKNDQERHTRVANRKQRNPLFLLLIVFLETLCAQKNCGIARGFGTHRCMARKPYSKGRVGWTLRGMLIVQKQARTTDAALQKPILTQQAHSDSCWVRQGLWVGNIN